MRQITTTALLIWIAGYLQIQLTFADVVVIANQTATNIDYRIVTSNDEVQPHQISALGQSVISTNGSVDLLFDVDGQLSRFRLDANSVYFFTRGSNERLDLRKIQLGGDASTFAGRTLKEPRFPDGIGRIRVKILVDDDEPTTRRIWEQRIRKRMIAASDILKRTCRLQLEIVAVGEWKSHDQLHDVNLLLQEFQKLVDPQPANLAIGFSSGADVSDRRIHLGGSPGLLAQHILLREWSSNMSEAERTEILLHEIGHYLGAVHSPDPNSVMRPLLGDQKARSPDFPIRFDPVNTLILNLVAEEILQQEISTPDDLTEATQLRLKQIYGAVQQADPDDDSARHFLVQLGLTSDSPLANGTRQIVKRLTQLLTENGTEDQAGKDNSSVANTRHDQLTSQCLQEAAKTARTLPDDIAPEALLLGLGAVIAGPDFLANRKGAERFFESIDSPEQRIQRRVLTKKLTLSGRRDLAQHFFVSAALTVLVGPHIAETAGLTKEVIDARSGTGFSYVDFAANLAGVNFAEQLLAGQLNPTDLSKDVDMADYMPDTVGLPESLKWKQITEHLSGTGANSFLGYRKEIIRRIEIANTDDVNP